MTRATAPFRVSHIVLDVDGTLVDFDRAHAAALRATAVRVAEITGAPIGPEALQAVRDEVLAAPSMRGATLRAVRNESLRRVLAERGVRDTAVLAEVSALHFATRDEELRAFPDVEAAVEELYARGFTLIAASNGNAALERLAITARFAHVHLAEVVGVSKPDPRFFALALEATDGRAETALSVGDRIENDYLPARSLGMHAMVLDRDGTLADGDVMRIASLAELPALVALP